ncbi:MAG: hypothetical protein JXA67_12030 [Micromonosporaceae bacterium]|nr:hypothetical protein [Micromonosporaceae bacterium]
MRSKGRIAAAASAVVMLTAGVAYGYFALSGGGEGKVQVGSGPSEPILIMPTTISISEMEVPVPLSGTMQNKNYSRIGIQRIEIEISSISASGTCSTEEGVDFVIEDVVPASPFVVAAATGPKAWGMLAWSGGSIKLRNAPDHSQSGCLGSTITLGYTGIAA